jgi:hypothetical protein
MLIEHKSKSRTWSDKPISVAANVSQRDMKRKNKISVAASTYLKKEKMGAKKHKCVAASHPKRKGELTDMELEVEAQKPQPHLPYLTSTTEVLSRFLRNHMLSKIVLIKCLLIHVVFTKLWCWEITHTRGLRH